LLSDEGWGWPSLGDIGSYAWPWGGNEEIDPDLGGDNTQKCCLIVGGTTAVVAGGGACYCFAHGGSFAGAVWRGGEIVLKGKNCRISPFGHGKAPGYSNNPWHRRLPHYHRRGPGGIGEHRPWQGGRF